MRHALRECRYFDNGLNEFIRDDRAHRLHHQDLRVPELDRRGDGAGMLAVFAVLWHLEV